MSGKGAGHEPQVTCWDESEGAGLKACPIYCQTDGLDAMKEKIALCPNRRTAPHDKLVEALRKITSVASEEVEDFDDAIDTDNRDDIYWSGYNAGQQSIIANVKAALQTKEAQTGECKKCAAGCSRYEGGEVRHHKTCPYYPDSMSEQFDSLKEKCAESEGRIRVEIPICHAGDESPRQISCMSEVALEYADGNRTGVIVCKKDWHPNLAEMCHPGVCQYREVLEAKAKSAEGE